MYYYIYDDFIATPKLQVKLADLESKLALLGIKGPVSRLHALTNINEVMRRAVVRGATTVIVVGDDRSLLKVLNALPNKKIVVGLITMGPQVTLARKLNIETVKAGIEAAAGRKLVPVNTGMINKFAFLQNVTITGGPFTAILDGTLTIKSDHPQSTISIVNPQLAFSKDKSSLFEAYLTPLKGRWSIGKVREEQISKLNFGKLVLKSQTSMEVVADGSKMINNKAITIDIVENAARLIVGRGRPEGNTIKQE